MYALYKKVRQGYTVKVTIVAVSKDKDVLERLLPREVEKYLKERGNDEYAIFNYLLPSGYKPRDYWTRGPFAEEEFEVVPVNMAY